MPTDLSGHTVRQPFGKRGGAQDMVLISIEFSRQWKQFGKIERRGSTHSGWSEVFSVWIPQDAVRRSVEGDSHHGLYSSCGGQAGSKEDRLLRKYDKNWMVIVHRQHRYISDSAPVPYIRLTIPGSKDWDTPIEKGRKVAEEGR